MEPISDLESTRLPQSALVIGAGVVGVATAYALARRGVAVTIIDRANAAGCGASFANGAQLSYVYTEALASPALLRHMPALALGLDPAFRLKPSLDPGQISWLLHFLRNATKARFETATLAGLALGLESRLAMHALLERHLIEFGHKVAGKMLVYQNAAAFASAREMVVLKKRQGAVQEILTPADAIRLEPTLAVRSDGFAGAIYSPQDELGDPHRFCTSLLALMKQELGVKVRLCTAIESWGDDPTTATVVTGAGERIEADQLVICAGIDARAFLKRFGLGAALLPMKGYSFTAPPGQVAPTMSITDVSRKIVFCPLDGKVRVAGLAELGVRDTTVDAKRLATLKATAMDALPHAVDYTAAHSSWAGIRPMTANSLPIMRRVGPRVTVNVGHGMSGWTYAMGSAERLAQLMGGN
jgi:D-amino-acid dehydrogenase